MRPITTAGPMTDKTPPPPAADAASDEELITRIAAGDRRAFTDFTQRHGDFLFATAVRMMRETFDAQDVVQDTLLRIWQKAGLWRPDGGASVRTWMYRIAYNACIDALRRRKPQTALPETLVAAETADAAYRLRERRAIVAEALAQLPERQRAALVLCHYQGLSNAEAAAAMGGSVKAVESLLIRARRQMRALLKPYEEGLQP